MKPVAVVLVKFAHVMLAAVKLVEVRVDDRNAAEVRFCVDKSQVVRLLNHSLTPVRSFA